MLYLFDLDGTLISSYMDESGRAYYTWRVLPGRRETLAQLMADGHRIGIVTNQAGVAFGHITPADVEQRLEAVYHALGCFQGLWLHVGPISHRTLSSALLAEPARTLHVYACYAHPKSRDARYRDPVQLARRKPSGQMIREAMSDAQATAGDTIYVGDRPEDETAARDAGVAFRWANAFFGETGSSATMGAG
jgi:D-glycero-D-manno-heptose 1,7-bisphosphate phosphatase